MRILLTHHMPLAGSDSGRLTHDLAAGLAQAGHVVMCLVVEGRHAPSTTSEPFGVERIRCWPGDPQADLAFDLPCLEVCAFTRLMFADLSDEQLVEYRNALRRKLDRCVAQFDPQVIHCQHAWLFAHLALESGAPYLITVHGPELRTARDSPRYRRFVEEAIENASRVVVHEPRVGEEIVALCPDAAARIEHIPAEIGSSDWVQRHVNFYQAALEQRFGPW